MSISNGLPFYMDETAYRLPTRGHRSDAGVDLYCSETLTIEPHGFVDVPTGVYTRLPNMTWGLLTGRSSTLRRHGLMVVQGVIDQDYRGELFAGVQNMRPHPVVVERGSRLAQLIVVPLPGYLDPVEIPRSGLGETARGEGGFGSTGV